MLIQLSIILLLLLFSSNDEIYGSNVNGRYKEVKTKDINRYGQEIGETVRILDTQTGEFVEP